MIDIYYTAIKMSFDSVHKSGPSRRSVIENFENAGAKTNNWHKRGGVGVGPNNKENVRDPEIAVALVTRIPRRPATVQVRGPTGSKRYVFF